MNTKRNIFIAFILNLFFSIFELFGGYITGSVAIVSDAIHDFGDAVSIGLAYFFEKTSEKKPNNVYSYGYLRFSVLGGFLTTLILLISSTIVIYNAILRLITPSLINHNGMLIFSIIGLFVNLIAACFTHGGKSINQKAVNLHIIEDLFGWIIVLIGAIIIKFTNFYIIDPILSIILAMFIIYNAIKTLIQITNIFLIKTPKNINVNEIIEHIKKIEGVNDAHHIHIWTLDGEVNCATLHVVVKEYDLKIKSEIKNELKEHGITHVTVEMEPLLENCQETSCNIKKEITHCHHHHH